MENIYNWDEKGFLIGHASATKRILTRSAYEQGRVRYVQQDGNREFVSLLACVCADGSALPPALIYKGASHDLQDTWLEDLQEEDEAYFASSAKGWTCDDLGLAWLSRFDQNTKEKGARRRLLLVDGHSSHVNMAFLALADSLRILVMILPPHSTHRLQPLDVGLFGPLAKLYTKELNNFTHKGSGWISMTKRIFWPLFSTAWKQSFTRTNILKSFEKTGIWPLDPQKTLKTIQKPISSITPSKLPILSVKTPCTIRSLRRLVKSSPSRHKSALLERAVLRLATENEIQKHENSSLKMAFAQEKKRRKRGQRLNLVGEKEDGRAQFYSPTRVLAAKAFQDAKEDAQEEERQRKAQKKEEAAYKRQQKEVEKQEKARQRQELTVQRQLQKQAAEEEKRARIAQRNAEWAKKREEKERVRLEKAKERAQRQKRPISVVDDDVDGDETGRPKKRSKLTSANHNHAIKTTNSGLQQLHRASKGLKQSRRQQKPAISMTGSSATKDGVEGVQNSNRRGRAIIPPQRFR